MSTAALPEDAKQVLREQVYARGFFEKLSRDWNIVPKTAAESRQLLEIAQGLRAARVAENEKAASAGNPFLAGALDGLRSALKIEGVETGHGVDLMKEAAFNLTAENPQVAYAALALAESLAAGE